ncbi:MAG: M24 family metallopeptidase, partial [Deinococcus-Thermus bacterium]|nr:M24 family metallopeptidase [Deinococcota bacterium]
ILQVGHQVDGDRWEIVHGVRTPVATWLADALTPGTRLGYDPRLHSVDQVKRLRSAAEKAGARLLPVEPNPIDDLWIDRPPAPLGPIVPHDSAFAGEESAAKRRRLAETLGTRKLDAAVLTQPESIAWLLNIRGRDVPNTPLPLAYAVLRDDATVTLFVDPAKLTRAARAHLDEAVEVARMAALDRALDRLGEEGRSVLVDPATTNEWVRDRLARSGAKVVLDDDPCIAAKAAKNAVEIAGARAAHHRDGVAMVRFLKWLDDTAPGGTVTELQAAETLTGLRAEGDHWRGISFPPISGAGSNGAIVHYRVTPESDRRLEPGTLYLIDSGGQYLDGTTDITRTVAIGEPTEAMRRAFTLVLKGHIAIATAQFPEATTGGQLDALARQFLWKAGLDFDHGTGHGVGAYLGVHEGPARLSSRSTVPLAAGMILSNEPGYYREGAFGIRIENLIVVHAAETEPPPERPMLAFETLTLTPIDRRLVMAELMTADEIAWLDAYHARVRQALSPDLAEPDRRWLEAATAPIG